MTVVAISGVLSSFLAKVLYPRRVRTPEIDKIMSSVGKMISFIIGLYTFLGFLFIIGFYRTSASVQLVLICIFNALTFFIRFSLRRFLARLHLAKYEGPTMFFLLSLSQFIAIQSLPKASQIYVYIASLIMRIFSGLWPLLSKFRTVLFAQRFSRVGISSSGEIAPEEKETNPLLFWDPEKEAVNSFATMYSTVASSVLFIPILLFLWYGYSQQYFIYDHLTSYELTLSCAYILSSAFTSVLTFLVSNRYFKAVYKIDSFQLGVEDYFRFFAIYVTASIYSILMFAMYTVRHSDLVYYVATPLYGGGDL